MHKILLSLLLLASAGVAFATSSQQVVLVVENFTCPTCSITIRKALDRVPGVTDRRIDADTATVTVSFDAERTDAETIAKAISEAGFPATVRQPADGD